MRYELRLTAYDVMDQVWVSTTLHRTPDTPGAPSEIALVLHSQAAGEGEQDPIEWTRDALVCALESL